MARYFIKLLYLEVSLSEVIVGSLIDLWWWAALIILMIHWWA